MFARLRVPASAQTHAFGSSSRAYSYFSQRPGRFFTPARRPGTPADGSKIVGAAGNGSVAALSSGIGAESGASSVSSLEASASSSGAAQTSSSSSSSSVNSTVQKDATSGLPPTAPLLHPQLPLPSLHLHDFFAQHRPLLMLDQPLSQLFQSTPTSSPFPPTLSGSAASIISSTESTADNAALARAMGFDISGQSDAEADADVARVLARAMVVQRIQASREWGSVMTQLGLSGSPNHDEQAVMDAVVSLDSVKRKRRKKMNKHK